MLNENSALLAEDHVLFIDMHYALYTEKVDSVGRLLDLVDILQNSSTLSDHIEDITVLDRPCDQMPSFRELSKAGRDCDSGRQMRTARRPISGGRHNMWMFAVPAPKLPSLYAL